MIEIIPATDIIDGRCVRLTQGDYARKKTYCDDPLGSGAAIRGGRHPTAPHGRSGRGEGCGAPEPPHTGAHCRADLARGAVWRRHQEPRGAGDGLQRRGEPRHLRKHRRAAAGAARGMDRGIRSRKDHSRGRHPRGQGGHSGLDRDGRDNGRRAHRTLSQRRPHAGDLHGHRARRHAVRRLNGILRRAATAVSGGGDHRKRRHRHDGGDRGSAQRGPAQRHCRKGPSTKAVSPSKRSNDACKTDNTLSGHPRRRDGKGHSLRAAAAGRRSRGVGREIRRRRGRRTGLSRHQCHGRRGVRPSRNSCRASPRGSTFPSPWAAASARWRMPHGCSTPGPTRSRSTAPPWPTPR